MLKEYPCKNCDRVKNPEDCQNKSCQTWQDWFTYQWSLFNSFYEKYRRQE